MKMWHHSSRKIIYLKKSSFWTRCTSLLESGRGTRSLFATWQYYSKYCKWEFNDSLKPTRDTFMNLNIRGPWFKRLKLQRFFYLLFIKTVQYYRKNWKRRFTAPLKPTSDTFKGLRIRGPCFKRLKLPGFLSIKWLWQHEV